MLINKEAILKGLRENLDTSLIQFAQEILALPEGPERDDLMTTTFSEIFDITSISTQDQCLAEMTKAKNVHRIQSLNIQEIENLLKCDRAILTKTLVSLEMPGGMNGWTITSKGKKRAKRYTLEKKAD